MSDIITACERENDIGGVAWLIFLSLKSAPLNVKSP